MQKEKKMKFSIITINYNNKYGLINTINSVDNLLYTDYEFIIIDGGSSDGSIDTIKKFEDNINYWISEKDNGIYHAMNKGVQQAHGEYCIFMNSGDCFHSPEILNIIEGFHEDIICGKVLKGNSTIASGHNKSTISLLDLMRGSLPHQAMFIKRELLIKHPYDENYKILSDWKFSIETIVFDNCTFRNLDLVIADYDTNGISTNSNGLLPKERAQILNELFPPRIIKDYERITIVDDELMDQAVKLTKTINARKLVKRFSDLILSFTHQKNHSNGC